MPRLQKRTKNRLISFLYEYRCAHRCGCANASDMVIVVMRNRDKLYRLCRKLLLNRAEQHLGLRLCVRRIHERQPLRKFNDKRVVGITHRVINTVADFNNLHGRILVPGGRFVGFFCRRIGNRKNLFRRGVIHRYRNKLNIRVILPAFSDGDVMRQREAIGCFVIAKDILGSYVSKNGLGIDHLIRCQQPCLRIEVQSKIFARFRLQGAVLVHLAVQFLIDRWLPVGSRFRR